MRKTLISALAISALLLSGCGGDKGGDSKSDGKTDSGQQISAKDAKSKSLEDITVTGKPDAKPEVKFAAPLVMDKPASTVVSEGSGAEVKEGQQVTANLTLVSGRTGKVVESSYDSKNPSGFPADKKQINPSLFDAVVGKKIGSRVLMTLEGSAKSGEQPETLVYVVDIVNAEKLPEPLSKAEGTERKLPAGLPQVTRDDSGKPSVSKPEGAAPKNLVVEPTIEGKGPEVKKGQRVQAHYSGWLYDDVSKQFDSSWEKGKPFSFTVGAGEVIKGWDEAVEGQKVGSQLLVIVPPDKGYGEQGSPPAIPGNATLIFVVDILAVSGGSGGNGS